MRLDSLAIELLNLTSHDDGHDNPVDGNGFAENDANQVLGPDSRSFDSTADDAGARCVDASRSANDRKRNRQTNSHTSPKVGRDRLEEGTNIKLRKKI